MRHGVYLPFFRPIYLQCSSYIVILGYRKIRRIRSSKAKEARPEIDECLLALVHTHAAHFVTVMAGGVKLNEYLLAGQPMKAFIATRRICDGCEICW